ncbi:PAS domain-containing sensor histidine kinase [Wukongibacter sp. M2B1]|uniref:sensor histidine kinase n=1 Tax=Wukongibacter sp. M2B1 TaxID=3088895 RepID=UPI003D7ACEEF
MKTTDKSMLEQCELLLDDVDMQLWTLQDIETYGFVNKSHANFLGKRKEDMENKRLEDVLIRKEAMGCASSNIRAWKEKEQIITKEWITNSKGEVRLLKIIKTPILDEEENIKYILCKAYDITEDENRKSKFRISEQQYSAIVESQKTLICRCLPNTELTYVNQAYCDYFNKTYEELIGLSFLTFVPEECHKELTDSITSFTIENNIEVDEHYVINSKGEMVWQRWTNQAFFDEENNLIEFQCVGIDITELKEKEETLQKRIEENRKKIDEMLEYDKLKTEFFANISHELRTPLNLILSTLQLLDFKVENDILELKDTRKNHQIIKQNCYRLLRLINNLIDITKIDSGYFNINLKNHNLINVVEDITLSVAEHVRNKNIQLLFDTDTEEKIMACDPDQIERIILNLLSNAVKFTMPGGQILVNLEDKGDKVIIYIKDTGIGIPSDKIDMIFKRFRQIDKSFTRSHEGSGIGLSLTESLVKMHGGEISVKSEYGSGSEFIISLPVKMLEDSECKIENNNAKNSHVESISIEFSDIYSIG